MAAGRPVIAYGKGGVLDTVIDGQTGMYFHEQTLNALMTAVETFEAERRYDVDPAKLIAHAKGFDENNFRSGMTRFLATHGISPAHIAPLLAAG